jgi:hypothetical protein
MVSRPQSARPKVKDYYDAEDIDDGGEDKLGLQSNSAIDALWMLDQEMEQVSGMLTGDSVFSDESDYREITRDHDHFAEKKSTNDEKPHRTHNKPTHYPSDADVKSPRGGQEDLLQRLHSLLPEGYELDPNIDVQDSLKSLTKVEQIHICTLSMYLCEPERFDSTVRHFVRSFAKPNLEAENESKHLLDWM